MLDHWCTGLVGGFVDVRSLCRSNSKTALNKGCACLVCVYVRTCDFYDSVWMCRSSGGLSRSSSVSIAPSFHTDGGTSLTCALTCRDVTRGNRRYLQVCMCVCVFKVVLAVLRLTRGGSDF